MISDVRNSALMFPQTKAMISAKVKHKSIENYACDRFGGFTPSEIHGIVQWYFLISWKPVKKMKFLVKHCRIWLTYLALLCPHRAGQARSGFQNFEGEIQLPISRFGWIYGDPTTFWKRRFLNSCLTKRLNWNRKHYWQKKFLCLMKIMEYQSDLSVHP